MPTHTGTGTSRPARRPDNSTGRKNSKIGNDAKREAKKLLMDETQLSLLKNNLRIASLYVNSRHLEMLSPAPAGSLYTTEVCELETSAKNRAGIKLYQITKLMYNEDEDSFEKLTSVYSALNGIGGIVALIIKSDGKNTQLYLGTHTSGDGKLAGELLQSNIKGQFPGCEIAELSTIEKNKLLESCGNTSSSKKTVRSLSMIPSRREDERQHDKKFSAQGYEKFIDAMNGHAYTLIVLSQSVSPDAMDGCLEGLEAIYTSLSPYVKETASYSKTQSDTVNYTISNNFSYSVSESISKSFGTSHTRSISQGRNTNSGRGFELFDVHFNSGSGTSSGFTQSDTVNNGTQQGRVQGETEGGGDSESFGRSDGSTHTVSINRDNKAVGNLLAKVDEHIKRINLSQTFGMWNSACYMISDDAAVTLMGTSTLTSLFSGDTLASPRAYYNQWDVLNKKERDEVLEYLSYLKHPVIDLTMIQETIDENNKVTRKDCDPQKITPAMMISGKEIPILMGLPKKSVPGITVDSMAEFGRNIPSKWQTQVERPIKFGNIFHMGQKEQTQTILDLDTFASHTFICGASGSGKSNTTYNLIQELIDYKIPFLVIEPAKGEYKVEFAGLPNVNIFTAGEGPHRLLRINPFEFGPGIHIREHLDNIIQVISACWPLYGAMPGILKQAFEQVYIEHGWDLDHSERIINKGTKFPIFPDLVNTLNQIIDESPYSNQSKGDYKGALLNRVSSLCNGFEGQIFGKSTGIPDSTLFNKNTIIDLSSIGSDETRSLIMGILIIKLRNFRKATSAINSKLIHVTVLEEAHNILKRCSHDTNVESGNVQGAAVGNLCRCIAEMRSSGEGFMIIDQSPGAVDEAAIKNTAIKICMRLPAKNDCEEIGSALSLKEEQIRELSRLDIGVAAIFHVGWTDTILAKMGSIWDKRYRIKSMPVLNTGNYIKVQSAIVQAMYQLIDEEDIHNIYNEIRSLVDELCKSPRALKPLLPISKQQEMLDEVSIFITNNDELIKRNRIKDLKEAFFSFVYEFLRLNSVMKVYTLNGVDDSFIDDLSSDEQKIALKWEKEVRQGVSRYLNMPEDCNAIKAYHWPLDPTRSQYFWEIYEKMIWLYACKNMSVTKYLRVYGYLNSINHFKPRRK